MSEVEIPEEKVQKIITVSEFYRDIKFMMRIIAIVCIIVIALYFAYKIWEWYFFVDFFISLPIAFIIARYFVKTYYYHILILDLEKGKLHYYRVSRKYNIEGNYSILESDVDVIIASKINIKKRLQKVVLNANSLYEYDRWRFLIDAKVVDDALKKLEKMTVKYYKLRKLFWNKLLELFRRLREYPVSKSLYSILEAMRIDIEKLEEKEIESPREVVEVE